MSLIREIAQATLIAALLALPFALYFAGYAGPYF